MGGSLQMKLATLAWVTASATDMNLAALRRSFAVLGDTPPLFGHGRAAQNVSVAVVDAHAGTRAPECKEDAPRLWLLLYGHYRSFGHTQHALAAVADESSCGCYVAVALSPEVVDETVARNGRSAEAWLKPGEPSSVSKLLATSAFGDRLAWATIERGGDALEYHEALQIYWLGVWLVARWAAAARGLVLADDAVVLRTRLDATLPAPFAGLEALSAYFATGARGRHVAIGDENNGCQGDIFLVTSYGAYEADVARPLLEAYRRRHGAVRVWQFLRDLGMTNGWGFGRSVQNRAPWPGMQPLLDGCVCLDDGPRFCAAADSVSTCRYETCLFTTVQAGFNPVTEKLIVRAAVFDASDASSAARRAHELRNTTPIDLTRGVHLYCPNTHGGQSTVPSVKERLYKGWFAHDRSYDTHGGKGGFWGREAHELPDLAWPPGCESAPYAESVIACDFGQ